MSTDFGVNVASPPRKGGAAHPPLTTDADGWDVTAADERVRRLPAQLQEASDIGGTKQESVCVLHRDGVFYNHTSITPFGALTPYDTEVVAMAGRVLGSLPFRIDARDASRTLHDR
jgi:hypothetical protein